MRGSSLTNKNSRILLSPAASSLLFLISMVLIAGKSHACTDTAKAPLALNGVYSEAKFSIEGSHGFSIDDAHFYYDEQVRRWCLSLNNVNSAGTLSSSTVASRPDETSSNCNLESGYTFQSKKTGKPIGKISFGYQERTGYPTATVTEPAGFDHKGAHKLQFLFDHDSVDIHGIENKWSEMRATEYEWQKDESDEEGGSISVRHFSPLFDVPEPHEPVSSNIHFLNDEWLAVTCPAGLVSWDDSDQVDAQAMPSASAKGKIFRWHKVLFPKHAKINE